MKQFLAVFFLITFCISCGPSEEEVLNRIDEAVAEAIASTSSSTTVTIAPTSSSTTVTTTTTTTIFKLENKKRAWCIAKSTEIINYYKGRPYPGDRNVKQILTAISQTGPKDEKVGEIVYSGLALFSSNDLLNGYIDGELSTLEYFNSVLQTGAGYLSDEICELWYEVVNT